MISEIESDPFVRQLQESVCSPGGSHVIPVGSQTKNGLIPNSDVRRLNMRELHGIVSYDPSEYLITARAGTSVAELQSALDEHGQYLPFDPMFFSCGATLGGTIASGISGPDRLLYGTVRDFVMEVAMIDGLGKFVRGGGKVVKNAAGFDTPKMMVGSYGRLGILLEATLKVFPAPQAWYAIVFDCDSIAAALNTTQRALSKPFPIAGLDIDRLNQVTVRLAGPDGSLPGAAKRLVGQVGLLPLYQSGPHPTRDETQHRGDAECYSANSLESTLTMPDDTLVRLAISPMEIPKLNELLHQLDLENFVHCGAGSLTWVRLASAKLEDLDQGLQKLAISGIVVRRLVEQADSGHDGYLGDRRWTAMARRIQGAVDPQKRYVPFK